MSEKHVYLAALGTETHTFAPLPTDDEAFATHYLARGGEHGDSPHDFAAPLVEWRRAAEQLGWRVSEGLCTFATPAGPTVRRTYERFRDEILEDVTRAHGEQPLDAVLLNLHGAMVADGYDDCEGDLVTRVRAIVGPEAAIGVELDLHCHLGRAFMDACTAVVIYKEYPHIDFVERAQELFHIIEGAVSNQLRPTMATFDCRMIGLYHTTREPMRGFVDRMAAEEQAPGVLSVSLGHGFPWADVHDLGARVVVVTHDDAALAASIAERLGREVFEMRDAIATPYEEMDSAIDAALANGSGPVALADMSDNSGGGAAGDSTFIAHRLIERGIESAAIGGIWDPVATGIAIGAGVGARLRLRVGGKTGPDSGDPLDLDCVVTAAAEHCLMKTLGDTMRNFGPAAAVRAHGIDFIIQSRRTQNFSPTMFEALDIDWRSKRILVVKSMQHFQAAYAPVVADIRYVAAPGTLLWDFRELPYTKVPRPVWPLDDAPFEANAPRAW